MVGLGVGLVVCIVISKWRELLFKCYIFRSFLLPYSLGKSRFLLKNEAISILPSATNPSAIRYQFCIALIQRYSPLRPLIRPTATQIWQ
jgi:hypothetical protein